MKVLLINPYITSDERYAKEKRDPMEPLGLLYLATYTNREIKKAKLNISIKILDAQLEGKLPVKTNRGYRSGLSDAQIKEELMEYKPDIVGIGSNYATTVMDSIELANFVKKICNCAIVLGGAHATVAHETLIKEKSIDAVVRGEGEETFFELIKMFYKKKNFDKVGGITYKKNNKVKINLDRPLIKELDSLPIPDRSLIPYKEYLRKRLYFTTMQDPVATLFSSRGCPYNCVFCSTHTVWRNKWRPRSPENMLEEVEYLIKEYGIREFSFMDDQFMGDKERIKKFCRIVIRKNLGVSFIVPPGISPALVDDEVINLMIKAGFYRICFSIDVGTEAARNFVRKPVQLEKMREMVKKANSKGLWTYAFFVMGYPYEKEKDIEETVKYAYSLGLDFIRFYVAQPYKGAELYDIYIKMGMLNENEFEKKHHNMSDAIIGTKYIAPKRLERLRYLAENRYIYTYMLRLLNPFYFFKEFFPKISSYEKFKYFLRVVISYTNAKKWLENE